MSAPRVRSDSGAVTPVMVAVLGVVVWAISAWVAGPVRFSLDRMRANSTADAVALAAVGWGDDLAHAVADANGGEIVALDRRSHGRGSVIDVRVTVDGVEARARAGDVPLSTD